MINKLTSPMATLRRIFVSIALCGVVFTAHAQKTVFPSPDAALAAIFPNQKTWVWDQADGDLNGDSIKDLAMLVLVTSEKDLKKYHLVVLEGVKLAGYALLSASADYCPAQKFYNLDITGSSLYVSEVHSVNADNIVTNTLQFRFNHKLADLELIGRENQWGLNQDASSNGLSVNYLTGKATKY